MELLVAAYPEGAAVKCALGLTPLGCVLAQPQPSWDVIVPILQEAQQRIGKVEKINKPSVPGGSASIASGDSTGCAATVANAASDWTNSHLSGEDGDKSLCNCIVQ